MTFLAPWAVWALAGVPVIVLLYLLKTRRRGVTVSTLLFWNRVLEKERQRAFLRKLRHPLSLLLHLLIFLCIVAALAKPVLARLLHDGTSIVLLVDTRARMQALEADQKPRMIRALDEARRLIRNARPGEQICLIEAGATPRVLVPFTTDERALIAGVNRLRASDGTGDFQRALHLAEAALSSRGGERQIIALTTAAPPPSTAIPLRTIACGTPQENVAITRFATRPQLHSPQTSEVFLALQNFGENPARGEVVITCDGRPVDVQPFELQSGEESTKSFPFLPPANRSTRGWLVAKIEKKDALPLDNTAYAVLPGTQPMRVLLVSAGSWFLEKLLAADQQLKFELLAPDAWKPEFAGKFDVVIFDAALPAGFALASAAGNFLFLQQSPFTTEEPLLNEPLISEIDERHPVLRLVSLQNVTIARAKASRLPPASDGWTWEVPLRSFEKPLLIVGERGRQRVAAFSFELTESDLPLRVAFPLLMGNLVHWLGGEGLQSGSSALAGEIVAVAEGQAITGPDETPVQHAGGAFQPLRNGFYGLHTATDTRWLAVNTFSAQESDLRQGAIAPLPTAAPAENARRFSFRDFGTWPVWQYFALSALLLFALEWWLFHRRRTE